MSSGQNQISTDTRPADTANIKRPWLCRPCPCTGLPWYRLVMFIMVSGVLLFAPIYIVVKRPAEWSNPATQFFFHIGTMLLSLFLGWQISKYPAEKRGTEKWLPAARTASSQLLAMRDQVSRMRLTGTTTCDAIKNTIQGIDEKQREPLETIVRVKCESCKSRLHDLENMVETTLDTWTDFIDQNCTTECKAVRGSMLRRKKELSGKWGDK